MHETPAFDSWVRKIHWRRDRLPTPVFLGFLGGSAVKKSACSAGDLVWEDLSLIPGLDNFSPGEGNDYPLEYFGLENSQSFWKGIYSVAGDTSHSCLLFVPMRLSGLSGQTSSSQNCFATCYASTGKNPLRIVGVTKSRFSILFAFGHVA